MHAFLSLGRWLFPIPFVLFGLLHLMNAQMIADQAVPPFMPAKLFWAYISGIGLLAAGVSMLIGKYDKLGATLLAIFLLLMVLMVQAPGAMAGGDAAQAAMGNLLKDLSLAGASMMYALHYAKDRSIIG
jgi:uncharacterized membrane protein YphA (DoxX/SURF4 family)